MSRQAIIHKINKYKHFIKTKENKEIYNVKLNKYVSILNNLSGGVGENDDKKGVLSELSAKIEEFIKSENAKMEG